MKYIVKMNGSSYEVEVERVSPFHMLTREEIAAGGSAALASAAPAAPAPAPAPAPAAPAPAPAPAAAPAAPAPAAAPAAPAPAPAAAPASAGGTQVTCPLRGSVLEVRAAAGQAVKAGDILFMVEAMKMENEIVAPTDGTVAEVLVKKGDTVESDTPLAVIR